MKLTDALASVLKANGVNHIFGLQGGAVVHIFDSLERNGIGVTYTHHEQSAALAAVAYAKVTENLGCAVVTTGPGATNALTGLLAAPALVPADYFPKSAEILAKGGNIAMLGAQFQAVVFTYGFVGIATLVILLIVKATVGLRVSEQDEERGLDFVAHGEEAYDPMNG